MTQRVVLIDGRFELLNCPDRIEVYDSREGRNSESQPVETIPLKGPVSDREAGRLALTWLLAYLHLSQSEYLNYLNLFLSDHPDTTIHK
jgi:hypothetical protein